MWKAHIDNENAGKEENKAEAILSFIRRAENCLATVSFSVEQIIA